MGDMIFQKTKKYGNHRIYINVNININTRKLPEPNNAQQVPI